jgi:hypothetical protein
LQPDDYRLLTLATGLGAAMARTALDILNRHPDCLQVRKVTEDGIQAALVVPQPDGAILTTILNSVRDFPVVSDKADPDRRMWDAIERLAQLGAMVARLETAARDARGDS